MPSPSRPKGPLCRSELESIAYGYFSEFLPYFSAQPEGSLLSGLKIDFSLRMQRKLGLAFLFEHKIRLNHRYFANDPSLMPYTLFHELTHIWLYNCHLDPGHTWRFYQKMQEFNFTGYPIDHEVHLHTRIAEEAQHVYSCPNCANRWYVKQQLSYAIFCGHCFDRDGARYIAQIFVRTKTQSAAS